MEEFCRENKQFHKFLPHLNADKGFMEFATIFLKFWERFTEEEWQEFDESVCNEMKNMDYGFFEQVQYFIYLWADKRGIECE